MTEPVLTPMQQHRRRVKAELEELRSHRPAWAPPPTYDRLADDERYTPAAVAPAPMVTRRPRFTTMPGGLGRVPRVCELCGAELLWTFWGWTTEFGYACTPLDEEVAGWDGEPGLHVAITVGRWRELLRERGVDVDNTGEENGVSWTFNETYGSTLEEPPTEGRARPHEADVRPPSRPNGPLKPRGGQEFPNGHLNHATKGLRKKVVLPPGEITCGGAGCTASHPNKLKYRNAATEQGWFHEAERDGGKAWCAVHCPDWVKRMRRAVGWIPEGSE